MTIRSRIRAWWKRLIQRFGIRPPRRHHPSYRAWCKVIDSRRAEGYVTGYTKCCMCGHVDFNCAFPEAKTTLSECSHCRNMSAQWVLTLSDGEYPPNVHERASDG